MAYSRLAWVSLGYIHETECGIDWEIVGPGGQEIEGGTLVSVRFVALHRHPAMNLTFRLAPQLINSFLDLFIAEAFTSLRGQ